VRALLPYRKDRGSGILGRTAAPPWPRRHLRVLSAALAASVIAGVGGWVVYMKDVALAAPADGTIHVTGAGGNCGDPGNNLLRHIGSSCSGKKDCGYVFDWRMLRDPGDACRREFRIEWTCAAGGPARRQSWEPVPAHGTLLRIACP
jgi:hypothetical protein